MCLFQLKSTTGPRSALSWRNTHRWGSLYLNTMGVTLGVDNFTNWWWLFDSAEGSKMNWHSGCFTRLIVLHVWLSPYNNIKQSLPCRLSVIFSALPGMPTSVTNTMQSYRVSWFLHVFHWLCLCLTSLLGLGEWVKVLVCAWPGMMVDCECWNDFWAFLPSS